MNNGTKAAPRPRNRGNSTAMKVKCVEALSAGCPLVTMPAGADRIEEGAGTGYLLASDATQFSKSVAMC
jgi:hypothetical protein